MDFARFGPTRRPFQPTPDTATYYPARPRTRPPSPPSAKPSPHSTALHSSTANRHRQDARFAALLETLDPAIVRVVLPAPRSRPADLLQAVLFDLGVDYHGLPEQELRLAVTDRLLGALAAGGPTVVVIDEGQHLTADVLEELRLWGNLETRAAKAVFVVLVALPALRDRLLRIDAAALAQPHRRPRPGSSRSMPPSP